MLKLSSKAAIRREDTGTIPILVLVDQFNRLVKVGDVHNR